MRSLKTIEMACSRCADALGDGPLSGYTAHDFDLRTQRSVLEKVVGNILIMWQMQIWCVIGV